MGFSSFIFQNLGPLLKEQSNNSFDPHPGRLFICGRSIFFKASSYLINLKSNRWSSLELCKYINGVISQLFLKILDPNTCCIKSVCTFFFYLWTNFFKQNLSILCCIIHIFWSKVMILCKGIVISKLFDYITTCLSFVS